jgi:prepilin-type N-terminal cleavage/methylation domain-containing protein
MSLKSHNQEGFTLIEIAVVLVIVGVLVGSFIGSVSSRIETTRRDNTKQQLEEIKEAIIGHAITHGRLPCPTTTTGLGREQPGPGVCTWQHGFVPGVTLGLSGNYNRDDLLTDSWGNPIRYTVSIANGSALTSAPGAGGMVDVGMAALAPDLVVCDGDSTMTNDCAGAPVPAKLTDEAPFILLSLGKDGSDFVTNTAPNSDQGENSGELAVAANAAGENIAYTVGANLVFVSKSYSDEVSAAGRFDDIVVWESKYVLYSRMMDAGQFP